MKIDPSIVLSISSEFVAALIPIVLLSIGIKKILS